jgi:hypothetical protein
LLLVEVLGVRGLEVMVFLEVKLGMLSGSG